MDLAISPPIAEEDKDKDADKDVVVADGWVPPKPTNNPKDFWGFDEKDPPLASIALAT